MLNIIGLLKHLRITCFYRILLIGMKIKQTVLIFALLIGLGVLFVGPVASAAKCGGVKTSIISCTEGNSKTDVKDTGIWGVLLVAINILTAGIGVAAVAGIVWGSILYTTASGKPEQVKKANIVIANTVLGIVAYALMFAFLNYIIPGGLFS